MSAGTQPFPRRAREDRPMAELAPGSEVAGCRIESIVGRGGMGVVYRATQVSLGRTVALKVIAPELASDSEFRERFKRESRLAASIEHPNVVPVYEAGETGDVLYLITRFVDGTDLRQVLQREAGLEPERAASLVGQTATALAAAHRRDLIHRDVKPANILIDTTGDREHAYLTDFGIARQASGTGGLTQTGMVVGTLDYLAPERIQDARGDARSDVYALGCVLFEVLTGRVPYPRDSDVAKMYAHLNDPVPAPREVASALPAELDDLVRRAMAKDPESRIQTAGELAQGLERSATASTIPSPPGAPVPGPTVPAEADAATVPAYEATAVAREPAPAAPGGPARSAPAEPASRVRRLAPMLLAALGLGLVAAIVAALSLGDGESGGGGEESPGGESVTGARSLAPVRLSPGADGVAAGAGSVWVTDRDGSRVFRVDPRSRRVSGRIRVGSEPDSLAVGAGGVWVTNTGSDSVSRIDPAGGTVDQTVRVGKMPEGLTIGGGAIWSANMGDGTVTRIEPAGDTRALRVGGKPIQLAAAGRSVWVTASGSEEVVALDVASGRRNGPPIEVGGGPRGIAHAAGRLWVAASDADEIAVVNPGSREVEERISVPANPREVRAGEGAIWVTSADAQMVSAVDPTSREVVAGVPVDGHPFGLGVGEGGVWAASLDTGLLTPIEAR